VDSKAEVALSPGGESKAVTAENRKEYVQLLATFCCSRGCTVDVVGGDYCVYVCKCVRVCLCGVLVGCEG
jgi:hypothetical protein